jgi:peptidoglycan/LPS O-acetylase OafA/YrhL
MHSEAALFTVLDHAVVRLYGKISYSFDLLHPLALWSAGRFTTELLKQFDWLPVSLILLAAFVVSVADSAGGP